MAEMFSVVYRIKYPDDIIARENIMIVGHIHCFEFMRLC